MDSFSLKKPNLPDPESLQEFIDALSDHVPKIEQDIAHLKQKSGDKVLIANLFRGLHTIKGDAALCKVEIGVEIAHPIESVMARVRNGDIAFSNVLAEAILLALDRLELAVVALAENRPLDQLKLAELVVGLNRIAETEADGVGHAAAELIKSVTGFNPASYSNRGEPRSLSIARTDPTPTDLGFFQTLALQYELRSPLFSGRSERQLRLALETNESAGTPVDPLQLEAAVYMHDVGMMFLPESAWLRADKLSQRDKRLLQRHPELGAGILQRMHGWEDAAAMVLQHHEKQDGAGYPHHLKGKNIVAGAKILAIVDTFESVTLKHKQRGEGRSMVRAIAEVNACDDQFDPEWIAHFNTVIRRMVEI
jgi:HD-GYP domain-containing protein (c-di-GMP phosphodiesterase class II)